MSYDDVKQEPGKQPFNILTLKLQRCQNVYGSAPCTAAVGVTGEQKCTNSWATCQDPSNYLPEDFLVRFCTEVSKLPQGENFIPLLKDVRPKLGEPDPSQSIGSRSGITAEFSDAPHDDIGLDPYVAERTYDPLENGTFWPVMRARWPYYKNREVVWYSGYLTEPFDLANFKARHYVAESLTGWGADGVVELTAKDPLILTNDDRAQCPRITTGLLAAALDDSTLYTEIDVLTADPSEYDIETWEPVGVVRIGDEGFQYTGTTPITDGVRLTGVTRQLPDDYECEKESHNAEDEVRKCVYFKDMSPIEVFKILMTEFATVPLSYIPYAEWETEYTTWLSGFTVRRLIGEPEGVKALLAELMQQSNTWGLWWDDEAQEVKYAVVRPADTDETVMSLTDAAHVVKNSVDVQDVPDQLVNEVRAVFGQRNPFKDEDEVGNYRRGFLDLQADSQSANELGERRVRWIYGRWHPNGNRAELLRASKNILAEFSRVPMRVEFDLERKDDSLRTAQFCDLTTLYIMDAFRTPRTTRVRVIRATSGEETVRYRAREDVFRGRFGRIAPGGLSGLQYTAASDAERAQYIFIADANGKVGAPPVDGYVII